MLKKYPRRIPICLNFTVKKNFLIFFYSKKMLKKIIKNNQYLYVKKTMKKVVKILSSPKFLK